MFQPVMSLVKGSAAAQPGSSSSFNPCGVVSGLSVTTQVLLRSVVESYHCPIMFFFSAAASCADADDAAATSADSAASARQSRYFMRWPLLFGLVDWPFQLALIGVSATGVSTGLPANQAFRLSTTS